MQKYGYWLISVGLIVFVLIIVVWTIREDHKNNSQEVQESYESLLVYFEKGLSEIIDHLTPVVQEVGEDDYKFDLSQVESHLFRLDDRLNVESRINNEIYYITFFSDIQTLISSSYLEEITPKQEEIYKHLLNDIANVYSRMTTNDGEVDLSLTPGEFNEIMSDLEKNDYE